MKNNEIKKKLKISKNYKIWKIKKNLIKLAMKDKNVWFLDLMLKYWQKYAQFEKLYIEKKLW